MLLYWKDLFQYNLRFPHYTLENATWNCLGSEKMFLFSFIILVLSSVKIKKKKNENEKNIKKLIIDN